VFADVLGQRSADVVDLVETSLLIAPDVSLVVAGVDQFTLAVALLFRHVAVLRSDNLSFTKSKQRATY
jgi:hypothetical protein